MSYPDTARSDDGSRSSDDDSSDDDSSDDDSRTRLRLEPQC